MNFTITTIIIITTISCHILNAVNTTPREPMEQLNEWDYESTVIEKVEVKKADLERALALVNSKLKSQHNRYLVYELPEVLDGQQKSLNIHSSNVAEVLQKIAKVYGVSVKLEKVVVFG